MNDLVKTHSDGDVIESISASADGKRNSFIFACEPTEQSMAYAACLWRQKVLETPNVKTPADWAGCSTAAAHGRCAALQMRKEEELAGRAIYFRDRNLVRKLTGSISKWLMPSIVPKAYTPAPAAPAPAPALAKKKGSMLDAMGDMGGFAAAVTEAAKTPASSPPTARATIPIALVSRAGESPLEMARRMVADRAR